MGPHHLLTEAPKSISHCRVRGSGRTLRHAIPVIYYTVECNQTLVLGTLLRTPKFSRTGGPSLRRNPSISALSTHLRAHIRQVRVTLLYPFGIQYGLWKIFRHIAVDPDTCIAPSLSNQETSILEVLLSLFTRSHSDPGALCLSLVCLELKIGGSMPGVA